MKKSIFSLITVASLLAATSVQATTYTYGFDWISNGANATASAINTGEAQFFVDISQYSINGGTGGTEQVLFNFRNTGSSNSIIREIYFDDGTLLGISTLLEPTGVNFTAGSANPGNLPGGNNINFVTSAGFLADANNPAGTNGNGIDQGESLGVVFDLINGRTFADTIAALNATDFATGNTTLANGDALRIGIHGAGFPDGSSASFVNGGGNPPVPEPSTYAMFGTAFAILGFVGYRSRSRRS